MEDFYTITTSMRETFECPERNDRDWIEESESESEIERKIERQRETKRDKKERVKKRR